MSWLVSLFAREQGSHKFRNLNDDSFAEFWSFLTLITVIITLNSIFLYDLVQRFLDILHTKLDEDVNVFIKIIDSLEDLLFSLARLVRKLVFELVDLILHSWTTTCRCVRGKPEDVAFVFKDFLGSNQPNVIVHHRTYLFVGWLLHDCRDASEWFTHDGD